MRRDELLGARCDAAALAASVQHQLRAAEERDRLLAAPNDRVPDLRRATAVPERRHAVEDTVARRAEEVRLQLDRREAGAAVGERRHASVPPGGLGARDG